MATKSFFLLPLALCLVFQSQYAAAQGGAMQKAAKENLIRTACAATSSPPLCSTTLGALVNNPYLDPTLITTTAVQAATKTAAATFDMINMSMSVEHQVLADPSLKQSLAICANEYKTAIDNMNKAVTALTQQANVPQVPQLLNTAIGSVTKCDSSGIKMTNKVVQIAAKNIDCSKLIKNALEIFQVYANYILNPEHNSKVGNGPLPQVGAAVKGGIQGSVKVSGTPRPFLGGVGGGTGGGYIPALMKGGGGGGAPPNAKR